MKPLYLSFLWLAGLGVSWLSDPGDRPSVACAEPPGMLVDTCFADTTMCPGDTLYIGGQVIADPGTYVFSAGLPPGCEEVLVMDVIERNTYQKPLDIKLCHGENARFGVYTFGRTGFYEIRLPGWNACDTLILLNLIVSDMGYPNFETEPDDGSGTGAIDLTISGDALSFQWSNGSSTEDIDGLEAGVYNVSISNADSCKLIRSVRVEELEQFVAPNTFTPNGDGHNDYFNLVAAGGAPVVITFRVYNRWGQLVYDNEDPEKGWDGTFGGSPQPAGTYFFFIQAVRQIGPEEVISYQGDITLLR